MKILKLLNDYLSTNCARYTPSTHVCSIQCKTACEFKKKGGAYSVDMDSAITAVQEGSTTRSEERSQNPDNLSQNETKSKRLKESANAVAKKQQQLQQVKSMLKTSPYDVDLDTDEARLQQDITQMLQQMLLRGRS